MDIAKKLFLRAFDSDYSGRMNRPEYLASCLALADMFLMVSFLMDLLPISPHSIVVPVVGMGLMITVILLWVPKAIKRLHDMGQSGAQTLLFAIPLINIFFSFYLLFAPGKKEENEYGDVSESTPSKEEWYLLSGILFLAIILLILPVFHNPIIP